jgi:hypothetical protein
MPKPLVSLRVNVPMGLFERVNEYRHLARHESKNQALVALLNAGLAALAKPVDLPQIGSASDPISKPSARSGPILFAGAEPRRQRANGEARP